MIIRKNEDIQETLAEEEGIKDVRRKILIGPDEGSHNIIMRLFKVLPGGHTPFHKHEHEHVVKIEKGRGIVVNERKEESVVSEGQSLFVEGNKEHQFKNPFQDSFIFLCIIMNPNKKTSK